MMLRSILPRFSCVFLFIDLALVIHLQLWKGKGLLAIVDPYNVLAWRLFVGNKGSIIQNSSIFLFTDHHGFFWPRCSPLLFL